MSRSRAGNWLTWTAPTRTDLGRVTDSADAAVEAGWLLPEDRGAMIADTDTDAEAADVP